MINPNKMLSLLYSDCLQVYGCCSKIKVSSSETRINYQIFPLSKFTKWIIVQINFCDKLVLILKPNFKD